MTDKQEKLGEGRGRGGGPRIIIVLQKTHLVEHS